MESRERIQVQKNRSGGKHHCGQNTPDAAYPNYCFNEAQKRARRSTPFLIVSSLVA
jgi:hypothetical protein